jgi:hypothetical protein
VLTLTLVLGLPALWWWAWGVVDHKPGPVKRWWRPERLTGASYGYAVEEPQRGWWS